MKRWILPLLAVILIGPSCTTHTKDLRKKIEAGDYIDAVYDYPWEQVYDAVAFVWRDSEDFLIASMYSWSSWDFARENKMMLCREQYGGGRYFLTLGIYFESQEESRTKVMFVLGNPLSGEMGTTRIERIIDESHFYLENGEEAYRRYTHAEALRTKKIYRSKGWR